MGGFEFLKFFVASVAIFFTPGYLLYRPIFTKGEFNVFERLPIYFALSLGIIALFGTFAYIFNFTFKVLAGIILTVCFLFFITGLVRRQQKEDLRTIGLNYQNKKIFFLLVIATFLLSIFLTLFAGISGSIIEGDALNFLGFIRKLVENPFIANRDAFYKDIIVDPTYGYNIWHLSVAFVSWLAKLDSVIVWTFLPAILTPVILLSFYLFAKVLFKSEMAALISLILFIFYYGISERMYIFRTSPYNMIVTNFIILPVALTLVFKYLNDNRIKYLIIVCFLSFVISTIHLFGFLLFLLSLFSYYLFHLIFRKNTSERINILKIILVSLIFIYPYLILRLPTIKIINSYYLQDSFPEMPHLVVWLNEALCYINPNFLAAPHYHTSYPFYPRMFYIVSFYLPPFLLIYAKKNNCALFLLSNILIVPFISLNPVLVPLLAKVITFTLVVNLSQLMPFLLVLGFISYQILNYLNNFLFFKKNSFYFLIFILILGLFNPLTIEKFITICRERTSGFRSYYKNPNSSLDAIEFIRKNIHKTSVFLCDEQFSLFISAFTKHYVMVTHPGHASAATVDQLEREEGAKKVLHQDNIHKTVSILKKYDVKYVVLNLDSGQVNPMSKVLSKFISYPKVFKKIYDRNGIIIFEVINRVKLNKNLKRGRGL